MKFDKNVDCTPAEPCSAAFDPEANDACPLHRRSSISDEARAERAEAEARSWRDLFGESSGGNCGQAADYLAAEIAKHSPPCAQLARQLAALVHHLEVGYQRELMKPPVAVLSVDAV